MCLIIIQDHGQFQDVPEVEKTVLNSIWSETKQLELLISKLFNLLLLKASFSSINFQLLKNDKIRNKGNG